MEAPLDQAVPSGRHDRRGFAELHRDVWRIVRSAPLVFLVVPVVLWLPFDLLAESLALTKRAGSVAQYLVYMQVGALGFAVAGTLSRAIALSVLVALSQGRRIGFLQALRGGVRLWFPVFAVWFLAEVLVQLGLLLLVVPGVVLLVRLALAQPACAFEELPPREALRRSVACVRRAPWSLVFGVSGAALLYAPLAFVPMELVPAAADIWLSALAVAPFNVLLGFVTIGLTLLYADLRDGPELAAPVGRLDPNELVIASEWNSGRGGVVVGSCASVACLAAGAVVFHFLALAPISEGDAAWERGDYEEALGYYERAIYWDSSDDYALHSIAWCRLRLRELPEALAAFDRAIELDPTNPTYQLDRVGVLIQLERFDEARSSLMGAASLEEADESMVEGLWSRLSEGELLRAESRRKPPVWLRDPSS